MTPRIRLVNLSLRLRGYGAGVFGECSNQRAGLSMRLTHDLRVRLCVARACACARAHVHDHVLHVRAKVRTHGAHDIHA